MCLKIGDKIKTNYSDINFTVSKVSAVCTCPSYLDSINELKPKKSKPHYHFTVKYPDGSTGYLNGYTMIGKKIKNVWNDDYITMINPQPAAAPGRPKGRHNEHSEEKEPKSKRLECRAAQATFQKLDWIRAHSPVLKGKSNSEIIACLIADHVLMQELFHNDLPRYK